MCEHVYLRSVIYKSFCNEFTIQDLYDINIIRGEYELLWRPCVSHLIHWQEVRGKTWNIQHIIELTMVKINPSFPQTISERVISQHYWSTFRHVKRGEWLLGWNHMSWSSRVYDEARWAWCASNQGMYSLSLYLLNLIPLPSSLRNQEGRCYSSPGFGSTCEFSFS